MTQKYCRASSRRCTMYHPEPWLRRRATALGRAG